MNTQEAQVIQRIESRKEHIRRLMEHVHHMVAGEDWALAIEYCNELEGVLREQNADSLVTGDET